MSLSSFLLGAKPSGKKRVIDTELDAIFHSQTVEFLPEPTLSNHRGTSKRKEKDSGKPGVHTNEPERKRSKPSLPDTILPLVSSLRKEKRNGGKRVRFVSEGKSEPRTSGTEESETVSIQDSGSKGPDDAVRDEDLPSTVIHETLQKDKPGRQASRKEKYVPLDETKERRDARTIFIGNLASDVAIKRLLQKQLHRHILAFVPTAKIESIRFRSVAFRMPTSKLSEASDEGKKQKKARPHERDRASSWRNANSTGEPKADDKKFLTASQKKKIAFINRDIHSDADSVHAYVVFAYPLPQGSRPANLPPLSPVLDPFTAARLVVEKCNGTIFLDRMLRVDTVVKRPTLEDPSDNALPNSVIGDPKLSIFVGNLDFSSKEEDLRVYFEGIVSAERGSPDGERSQEDDKPKSWVTRVRMIRDKDTQLGKGFAYVQFMDRTCVDEVLALEPGKLKFANRKLRVQRCKAGPNPPSSKNITPSRPAHASNRAPVPPVPKGDPSLGKKLVKLTKEERKRVKAADVDRVARRMAKKKARMELAKQGVPERKQRERVRKTSTTKKPGSTPAKKASKGRVRSEKSITNRNTKK